MHDLKPPIQLILLRCMSLILLTSVTVTCGQSNCNNRMDLVIAVDTTSSISAGSFDNVKAEVKGIVSGLTIGQHATRLALISISQNALVVVNFNAVNSLAEFNTAVDGLTFSTDTADLSAGIKVAKESVLNTARGGVISKVLLLVKDRRLSHPGVSDAATLARMKSEAAAVKSLGAVIHAIGTGGLWNTLELNALYGTDYLLFKDKSKALGSAKSLGNIICKANCSNKGTSVVVDGQCFESTKHMVKSTISEETLSSGRSTCRKKIGREFSSCETKDRCNKVDRVVSACGSDGKVTIESSWQGFDRKLQSCVTAKSSKKVVCADANKCGGQVADVIIIRDRSGSILYRFSLLTRATRVLIESMNVGADNVRVGIMSYSQHVQQEIEFGSILDKATLIRSVEALNNNTGGGTNTGKALKQAREALQNSGRRDVAKFVFIITDGASSYPDNTFSETALVKNDGITLFAIGVGNANESELRTLTAPESDTNMLIVKDFNDLEAWTQEFSKTACIQMSEPHPRLCDHGVFVQSISSCTDGKQHVTRTEYRYNAKKKCTKTTKTTVSNACKSKCIDPIDGNEYIEGTEWTTLCHKFKCSVTAAKPFLPLESKCLAADGSCKDVGSATFKCRNEKGAEIANCQCANDANGKPALQIDYT